MGTIFLLSWLGQSITGRVAYNAEQFDHQEAALGSMAVLAIYLRQRGSPESKPVGTPHDVTGAEG